MSTAECVSSSEGANTYLGKVELKFQGREISTSAPSSEVENIDNPAIRNEGMSLANLLNREMADSDVSNRVSVARRRLGQAQKENGLAKLRLSAGLSQKNVADAMGLQQPAIARWERHPGSISAENMRSLARALNLSMSDVAEAIDVQLSLTASQRQEYA